MNRSVECNVKDSSGEIMHLHCPPMAESFVDYLLRRTNDALLGVLKNKKRKLQNECYINI